MLKLYIVNNVGYHHHLLSHAFNELVSPSFKYGSKKYEFIMKFALSLHRRVWEDRVLSTNLWKPGSIGRGLFLSGGLSCVEVGVAVRDAISQIGTGSLADEGWNALTQTKAYLLYSICAPKKKLNV